jgi:hypothetical protein
MSSVPSLLDKIKSLSARLELDNDVKTRNEVVQLSRQLTATLSRPEDVAAEVIFSVSVSISTTNAPGF